jgi:hypothetical protein
VAVTAQPTTSDLLVERRLQIAAMFFTFAVLFHNSDHLRRGSDTLSMDVFVAGSLAMILEVGVVALIFMRHRLAPIAAVSAGFPLAAGYVFVHFTPSRGWLSDSFVSESVSIVSRIAASTESLAALALGFAGWYALRERGWGAATSGSTTERRVGEVLRNPFVATMILGNAVIFVLTVVTW